MKVHVIQSKNENEIYVSVSVKNQTLGVLEKMVTCGILVHVIASLTRHLKIDEYLNIKNCSCEKTLFGKLVLACKDETLNKTEAWLNDTKVTCKKGIASFPLFWW